MAIRPPINMKQLIAFIRKEFYHVFRDRRTLLILFGIPIAQIILFGQALSSEVKNIGIAVLDEANNTYSQEITHRLQASPYFKLKDPQLRYDQVEDQFKQGTIKAALIFSPDFGKDLYTPSGTSLQLITDGSDPNTAKTVQNYFSAMVASYQQELNPAVQLPYQITVENRMLYNEEQNGSMNFVPGVIALVFMIVSTALTSVAVVREKELGTMEILLVSPFKPIMILIAKAVLIAMMGMMLPTAFFTGFMFPIENMPLIFQGISKVFPSSYYYSIVKKVMLKGLDFSYIWKETLILIAMAVVFLSLAMKKFKIRLQ